ALGALGKTGQSAARPQGADAVAAIGQDLVRVGLMADVPNQAVLGRIEDIVQRHRQFDHAQAGAEMAAGHGNGIDGRLAQLVRHLAKLARLELPEICRGLDLVEQRGLGGNSHAICSLRTDKRLPTYGLSPNGAYWGLVRAHPHARWLPVFTPLRQERAIYRV